MVQVHQVQVTSNVMKVEVVHDEHQNVMAAKTGVLGPDAESRVAERPRLNLKPRSNVTGQSDEIAVKERYVMFRFQISLKFSFSSSLDVNSCLPYVWQIQTCPTTYFGFPLHSRLYKLFLLGLSKLSMVTVY